MTRSTTQRQGAQANGGHRIFRDDRLVVATHNVGKMREFAHLMAPLPITLLSTVDLGLPELDEVGLSFADNAVMKAEYAAQLSNLPALADDSGLVVPVLGGAPGVFSARWGGHNRDYTQAMQRVNDRVAAAISESEAYSPDAENEARRAHFVCALALCWPDNYRETFEGVVSGNLVWPARGDRGFGFDPIFSPEGYAQTFGEIDPVIKERVSHRGRAFRKMIDACFSVGVNL